MAKRKAKSNSQLRRSQAKQKPYDRVLIVCEGAKSEPLYFKSLIKDLRLSTANVKICGEECDSSPDKVLEYAHSKQDEAISEDNPFDKIFCVIDKDGHAHYQSVLEKIKNHPNCEAINSVPCFEYWVLLHFEYTDSPFAKTGSKSCCDTVKSKVKNHLKNYHKGDASLYDQLELNPKSSINDAIVRAKQAMLACKKNSTDNPSTRVHELVEYLRSIKSD